MLLLVSSSVHVLVAVPTSLSTTSLATVVSIELLLLRELVALSSSEHRLLALIRSIGLANDVLIRRLLLLMGIQSLIVGS